VSEVNGKLVLDITAQTHAVIKNIEAILHEAGATLANLVDITVFLTNMDDYAAFNKVYNQYFQHETGPSRTTVGVRQLPSDKLLIEIKAVGVLPKE
jgi:2-aminomuconate deaminase